jgi:hypothetical protein
MGYTVVMLLVFDANQEERFPPVSTTTAMITSARNATMIPYSVIEMAALRATNRRAECTKRRNRWETVTGVTDQA